MTKGLCSKQIIGLIALVGMVSILLMASSSSALGDASSPVSDFLSTDVLQDPSAVAAPEWTQVQNNPQHTGYTEETIGTNIHLIWTHPFQPERIAPQVQPIIYNSRVYVGTEMGTVYALNAATGNVDWNRNLGAPIIGSVAAGDGQVYVATLDGAMFALNANTSAVIWRSQASIPSGFSVSPVLAEGKVMAGNRNGIFYAFDSATGNIVWQYDVGAPILQTAAWDNGLAIFGAMDMYVYALNTANNANPRLAWKSEKIPHMGFKDYWPVIHGGRVFIRPMGAGDLSSDNLSDAAQNAALAAYDANPSAYNISLYILNESNGQFLPTAIHWDSHAMNGAISPPCVDRDGYLIFGAPVNTEDWYHGWGRLNPNTRKFVQFLSTSCNNSRCTGLDPVDESYGLSCANNAVLTAHMDGAGVGSGAFFLDTNSWVGIGKELTDYRLSAETGGGGTGSPSISNGMIYLIGTHELMAWGTR